MNRKRVVLLNSRDQAYGFDQEAISSALIFLLADLHNMLRIFQILYFNHSSFFFPFFFWFSFFGCRSN